MRHQTERKRAAYYQGHKLGWSCVTCQQWWTRAPTSSCPGVPAYHEWDAAQAAGLRTITQWKAERRKVLFGSTPRGAKMKGAAHPSEWYDLYAEEQTAPMRAKAKATVDASPDTNKEP